MERKGRIHPWVPELQEQLRQGKISRREFIRLATLLGTSVAAATAMAACAPKTVEPTPVPVAPTPTPKPEMPTATPVPPTATPVPPTPTPAPTVQRGGTLRLASYSIGRIDHPARYSWVSHSQSTRQVAEYLTLTDSKNITHPYLLEKWEASDDLKTWTLYLRKNVTWNNGDKFVADDVVFTMKQWLDPEVGSSILGLMSYLKPDNIEKVDDYTVRLHLDSPQIGVPEHLFHYPAQIMNHRTFEGDFLKAPVGTGPFTIQEYAEGVRVVLKRRKDYWRNGVDGQPLPYLDEVIYVDLGSERSAHTAAFQAGQVDIISEPTIENYLALKDDPNANVFAVPNAGINVVRMRVDKAPWTDERVRLALKLCQNREKIRKTVYYGLGELGQDHHVAPVHPEYCDIGTPKYDPERAKALLAEAGFPNGLDVEMIAADVWLSLAQVIKADAEPAGFRITIKSMPISSYWDIWTEADFAITNWAHRPLGTMVLTLAYICDAQGKPVPWNETRWCDSEFESLLNQAQATLDVEKRRAIMCKLEKIQQERGSVGISCWLTSFAVTKKYVQNYFGHPTFYDLLTEVWLKKA